MRYFLKNQKRMRALADMQYDRKKDRIFFTYLDRLLNSAAIVRTEVVGTGPKLIDRFVTGKSSIA